MAADFATALEGLRRRFLERAAADRQALSGHRAHGDLTPQTLLFIVHRLAGSSATFGYEEVSVAALAAQAGWDGARGVDAAALDALIAALDALPPAAPAAAQDDARA